MTCWVDGSPQKALVPFAAASLVLVGGVIPAILISLTCRNSDLIAADQELRLSARGTSADDNPVYSVRQAYGGLYAEFRAPFAWWWYAQLLKKLALLCLAVFTANPLFHFVFGIAAISVAKIAHELCSPYLGRRRRWGDTDAEVVKDLRRTRAGVGASREFGMLRLDMVEDIAQTFATMVVCFGYIYQGTNWVVGSASYVITTVIVAGFLLAGTAALIWLLMRGNIRYARALRAAPAADETVADAPPASSALAATVDAPDGQEPDELRLGGAADGAEGVTVADGAEGITIVETVPAAASGSAEPVPPHDDEGSPSTEANVTSAAAERVLSEDVADDATVEEVLESLESGTPAVQARAANALAVLEVTQECSTARIVQASIPRLLELLDSSAVLEVQLHAAAALWNFGDGCESLRLSVVRAGAFRSLLRALSSAPIDVHTPACGAISGLLVDDSSQRELFALGGVPALCRLLESSDEGLLVHVAAALWSLSDHHRDICDAMIGAGVVEPLVRLLRDPARGDTPIFETVAGTMAHVASDADARVRDLLVGAGALPLLTAILRTGTPGQQEQALGVLVVLIVSDEDMHITSAVMATSHAVPALLALLASPSADVQAQAAAAVAGLAASADSEAVLVRAGAVPPLVRLLQSPSSEAVRQAATAIWSLAASLDAARAVVDAGGAAPLAALLRSSDASEQELAGGALACLAVHHELHASLVAGGCTSALLERCGSESRAVREAAVSAVCGLSGSAAGCASITAEGGVAALAAVVSAGATPADEVEYAVAALANVTAGSGAACRALYDAGALPRLAQLIAGAAPPATLAQAVRVIASVVARVGEAGLAVTRSGTLALLAKLAASSREAAIRAAAAAAVAGMAGNAAYLRALAASAPDMARLVALVGSASEIEQDFALMALENSVRDVDAAVFRPALARAGGIPLLARALDAAPPHGAAAVGRVRRAAAVLRQASELDDDVCAAVLGAGTVPRALALAQAADAGAAAAGAALVAALAEAEEARAAIGAGDGVRILLLLLRTPALQEDAACALYLLTSDLGAACGAIAGADGGLPALTDVLRSGSAGAREKAAYALGNIGEAGAGFKGAIAGAGALARLAELLRAEEPPAVQEAAAQALAALCTCDGDPAHARAVVGAPGASARLVALLRSPAPATVQAAAARAVAALAANEGLEVALAAAGAVAPLVDMLASASPEGVAGSASALWGLCAGDEGVRRGVAAAAASRGGAGIVELLARVLATGAAPARVQACGALSCLLADDAAQAALVDCGGLAGVVEMLGSRDEEAATNAAGAVRNLASGDGRVAAALVQAGAVPRLVHALQSPSEAVQALAAGSLAGVLERCSRDGKLMIRDSGAPALLRGLHERSESAEVRDAASAALELMRA